jgi:NCAIR mutase (PurE)-related protein
MSDEAVLDFGRMERIGLEEAVYAAGKSPAQIAAILDIAGGRGSSLLLTRLDPEKLQALPAATMATPPACSSTSAWRACGG